MNKETYLQDLRKALKILPQYDRDEAVEFYEEYFEEAGVENEAKVIEELGEPKVLAKKILVDVVDKKYEEITGTQSAIKSVGTPETVPEMAAGAAAVPAAAYGTESTIGSQAPAYQGTVDGQQVQGGASQPQEQKERAPEKTSSFKTLWIVLAAIFALPLSPVVFALFIVAMVLILVVYIVLVTFIITTFSFIIAGGVMAVLGAIALFLKPVIGMCVLGTGLVLFGLGVFGTIGTVALFRLTSTGLSRLFGRIVHKKNRKNKAKQAQA